jgi:hypothetical protein
MVQERLQQLQLGWPRLRPPRAPICAGLADIIVLLIEALKGMGATDHKLVQVLRQI